MAGFITDDLADTDYIAEDEDTSDDDELQELISTQHAKFTAEQQAKQEALQGSRPWSAPPLMSPRPQTQLARQEEASSYADPEAVVRTNSLTRTEYEPPAERTGLRSASSVPQSFAHLLPARPMSAGHSRQTPSGVDGRPLQDILEDSPLDEAGPQAHTGMQAGTAFAAQHSEAGNLSQQESQADSVADEIASASDAVPDDELYNQLGKSVSQVPSRRGTSEAPSDKESHTQQEEEEEEEGEGEEAEEGDGMGHQDVRGADESQEPMGNGGDQDIKEVETRSMGTNADTTHTAKEGVPAKQGIAQDAAGWSEGAGEASLRPEGDAWIKGSDGLSGAAAGADTDHTQLPQPQQHFLQAAVHVPTHMEIPAQESLPCVVPEPQAVAAAAAGGSGSQRCASSSHSACSPAHVWGDHASGAPAPTSLRTASSRSYAADFHEAGSTAQQEEQASVAQTNDAPSEAATDYGQLMHPQAFALQLLHHDMHVMPELLKHAGRRRPSSSKLHDPGSRPRSATQPGRADRPQSAPGPHGRPAAMHAPYGMHAVDSILQPKQGTGRRHKHSAGAPLPQHSKRQQAQGQFAANDAPPVSDDDAEIEVLHCDSIRNRATGQRRSSGCGELMGGWAQVLKRRDSEKAARPSTAPSGGRAAWAYSNEGMQVPQQPVAMTPREGGGYQEGSHQPWWTSSPYLPASYRAAGMGKPGHRQRPSSAHPTFGRPASPGMRSSAPDGLYPDALGAGAYDEGAGGIAALHQLASTAAVDVGGTQVSVYVADTVRKVKEANKYMAALGLRNRYRLRDHSSNMQLQVYDSAWCPSSMAWDAPQTGDMKLSAVEAQMYAPTLREITLQSFLVTHARLRAQVPRY